MNNWVKFLGKRKRRTQYNILERLVTFLESRDITNDPHFYQSDLVKELKINETMAKELMRICILLQQAPKVKLIEMRRNIIYEILEEKAYKIIEVEGID